MGGYPPLGYDVKDRKLVLNSAEAETVRHIFRRYQELGSVRLLKEHLDETGIVSKHRSAPDGRPYGGKPVARGALYHMLQNRIYRGEIVHKHHVYPGEHELIVDEDLWQEVQTTLAANRIDRGAGQGNRHLSLLAGLIYDALGEPMTPSHAVKKGVRYRYYVSKLLLTGEKEATKGQRIPAAHIEALVTGRIRTWLADPIAVLNAVQCCGSHAAVAQKKLLDRAARLAGSWQDLDADRLRAILRAAVARVQVHSDRVDVTVDQMGVALWLNAQDQRQIAHPRADDRERHLMVLTTPARLKRTGIEMRLVVEDGSEPAKRRSRPGASSSPGLRHTRPPDRGAQPTAQRDRGRAGDQQFLYYASL